MPILIPTPTLDEHPESMKQLANSSNPIDILTSVFLVFVYVLITLIAPVNSV